MIHFYYGYGKGKTTAAMGLALRALGCGQKVVVVQFLKDKPSGEVAMLEKLPGAKVLLGKGGKGFTDRMTEEDRAETVRIHNENLKAGCEMAAEGGCGMLVLDEVGDAVLLDLLDKAYLEAFLDAHKDGPEIVMTGHALCPALADRADYVTEMKKHKHPYDSGQTARRGVEF